MAALLGAGLASSISVPLAAQADGAAFLLRVTEAETGQPLAGARVEVLRRELRGVTGLDGWVRITGVPEGIHLVEVRLMGFVTERMTLDFTRVISVKGHVSLHPQALTLGAVEVVAERIDPALQANGFYQRRRSSGGTFLTRSEISARAPGGRLSSLLASLPGFSMRASGTRGYALASRRYPPGIGGCATRVFVDGVPRPGAGASHLDGIVPLRELEALEWYAGPATTPPEFNYAGPAGADGSACGTLVLWTRSA
jgi:hypothetical protein